MTRKLMLLDLALVAVLAALAWQMRREWIDAHARPQALLSAQIKLVPPNRLTPLPKVAPLAAISYAEVAQLNLLSRDRNPQVVIDVEPPKVKPLPPFPVARGVLLWEGTPPTILLSTGRSGRQRAYRVGDQVGEWKIISLDNQYVTFEWDGKEYKKRIDELMDRTAQVAEAAQPAAPAAAPAAANPVKSQSLSSDTSAKSAPGIDVGSADTRGCQPGDDAPAGTVVDGFKKVVSTTPFGKACRWEQVK